MGHRRPNRQVCWTTVSGTNRRRHVCVPIQLLRPLDDLPLISHVGVDRRVLLTLKREVCRLDPHRLEWAGGAESEIGLVQHLDGKIDRLRPEVNHQHLAFEFTLIIGVHLDPRAAAVNFLGDDSTF